MEEKTFRLDFRSSFTDSVDKEVDYWQQVAPATATALLNRIVELINDIEKMPFMFPECKQLPTKNKMYRVAFLSAQYSIIYKVSRDTIIYILLFNNRQNPDKIKKIRTK
jgi:Txe/YoeB family toxin of Txe-Axe toxin-antitoxin module